jgi:hypothetical protein
MSIIYIPLLRLGTIVILSAACNAAFVKASSDLRGVSTVNRRDQVVDGRVCLVEPSRRGRCPRLSSVPGSLQTITQARKMSLPECNDNGSGPLIGSESSDWALKRKNETNSVSYVFALPDPIRGAVSLVLNDTFAILRNNLVGTHVAEFESLSLPTYTTGDSASTVDLSFHVINTIVTDIATNPNALADCIITYKINVTGSAWQTTKVDKDTRITSFESFMSDCPMAATLADLGPEWSFYTSDLGVECAFGVDVTVRNGAATFDNIAVSTGGWTTVYDFEL